jgi:predicted HAD superfamily phosphohydrolase
MKSYFQKILFICIVNLTFTTITFSQDIGSEWLNVRGMNNQQIETMMKKEIDGLKTYTPEVLEKAMVSMNNENDARITEFNDTKFSLRSELNTAIDNKNDLSIEVNDLNDDLNLRSSELSSLEQKILDADSSSNMSSQLIKGEKARVEDELTKIPFYEVMIARVKDFPKDAKNVGNYDDKMGYEIARMAIESQRGLKIINETVVSDNTLTRERVNILLQGKANENLTLVLANRIDQKTQEVKFDRYRYGLVTVYPFQEKDVDLTLTRAMKNINCDVEIIKDINQGLAIGLPDDEKRRARSMLNDAKVKNTDSESQIKRLARTSKRLIDQENRKIDRNKKKVEGINNQINILKPEIADTDANLIKTEKVLTAAIQDFNLLKEKYNSHVFNESYVEVFPWEGYASADESISQKYIEFGIESFHEFLSSIRSEYIKEETESIGDGYSEIKESKKTNVIINEIKLLGTFAKTKGRRQQLSIYIAYNYGFEFEQATDTQISGTMKTTPSKSQFFSFTKQERPLKPKDNLKITSKPSGANIFVSGRKIGVTPLKTYLDPGKYNLVFKKDGYQPGMDLITIKASGMTRSKTNLTRTAVADKTKQQDKGSALFSKKNLILAGGGVAILGGALLLLSQDEEETKQTGSVSISINIP